MTLRKNRRLARLAATLIFAACSLAPVASQTAAPQTTETVSAFYMRYRGAIEKSRNVSDVIAFWSAEQARQYADAPESERLTLVEIKRLYGSHSNVRVVSETWTSATSITLRLEGLDVNKTPVTGAVVIVIESGALKVSGPESWR